MVRRQSIHSLLLLTPRMLFPATLCYFSPYLIVLGGLSGTPTGRAMASAAQFLSALVLGRPFRGRLCPAGALQDGCAKVVKKSALGPVCLKYILWAAWLAGAVTAFVHAGGVRGADFFSWPLRFRHRGVRNVHSHPGADHGRGVTAGAACHVPTLCWMAPFKALGDALRRRLKLTGLYLAADGTGCADACPKKYDLAAFPQGFTRQRGAQNRNLVIPIQNINDSSRWFFARNCVACRSAQRCISRRRRIPKGRLALAPWSASIILPSLKS